MNVLLLGADGFLGRHLQIAMVSANSTRDVHAIAVVARHVVLAEARRLATRNIAAMGHRACAFPQRKRPTDSRWP